MLHIHAAITKYTTGEVMRTQLGESDNAMAVHSAWGYQVPFCTSLCNLSYYSWELWRRNKMCGRERKQVNHRATNFLPEDRSYNLQPLCSPFGKKSAQLTPIVPLYASWRSLYGSLQPVQWAPRQPWNGRNPQLWPFPYSRDESLNFLTTILCLCVSFLRLNTWRAGPLRSQRRGQHTVGLW